jgi:hypothetical protein
MFKRAGMFKAPAGPRGCLADGMQSLARKLHPAAMT